MVKQPVPLRLQFINNIANHVSAQTLQYQRIHARLEGMAVIYTAPIRIDRDECLVVQPAYDLIEILLQRWLSIPDIIVNQWRHRLRLKFNISRNVPELAVVRIANIEWVGPTWSTDNMHV